MFELARMAGGLHGVELLAVMLWSALQDKFGRLHQLNVTRCHVLQLKFTLSAWILPWTVLGSSWHFSPSIASIWELR